MTTTQTTATAWIVRKAEVLELHNADGYDIGAAGEASALRTAARLVEALGLDAWKEIKNLERKAQQNLDYDIEVRWNAGQRSGFRAILAEMEA